MIVPISRNHAMSASQMKRTAKHVHLHADTLRPREASGVFPLEQIMIDELVGKTVITGMVWLAATVWPMHGGLLAIAAAAAITYVIWKF
jgi:uncharacterized protein (DUF697 family)